MYPLREALVQPPQGVLKKGQALEQMWDTGGNSELDRRRYTGKVKSSDRD